MFSLTVPIREADTLRNQLESSGWRIFREHNIKARTFLGFISTTHITFLISVIDKEAETCFRLKYPNSVILSV